MACLSTVFLSFHFKILMMHLIYSQIAEVFVFTRDLKGSERALYLYTKYHPGTGPQQISSQEYSGEKRKLRPFRDVSIPFPRFSRA
jgi:hypothetical protein